LTTVVARVCLNLLRSRNLRREDPIGFHLPDPIVSGGDGVDPENEALLADSVGLALQVVLDTLTPAERLAFVLHDMFDVPFEEIAPLVGRSRDAARQLASRVRRRVQRAALVPDVALAGQREVVDAFFSAARAGDFDALVAVLDPDVVLRSDRGGRPRAPVVVRGAADVAGLAMTFARPSTVVRAALVNGAAGAVVVAGGRAFSVMGFTVARGKIVEIDVVMDPRRLGRPDVAVFVA